MAENIYQKLLAVQKAVVALGKDATNPHHKYEYVSSSNVLGAFRTEMDEQGLLLMPTITGTTLHLAGDRGAKMNLLELDVEFTWVNSDNPEERQTFQWYGQGIDTGEQSVGKALTYAEKSFLLKFFHIGTDGEDPDAYERPQEAPAQKQEAETLLGDTGKAKFDKWLEDKPEPVQLAVSKELTGFLEERWGVDTVDQVPASGGQTLLGWAYQREEQLAEPTEEQEAAEFFELQKQAKQIGVPTEGLGTAQLLREEIAKVEQAQGDGEDGTE